MFKKIKLIALSVVLSIGAYGCAKEEIKEEDKLKITLVLDEGGVNDQSFNQSAGEGAFNSK